jgi:hypothetical protein
MIKTLKAFGLWLLQGVLGAVFVLGLAFVLVEWASGCGEPYVDSKGKTHINECVLFSKP